MDNDIRSRYRIQRRDYTAPRPRPHHTEPRPTAAPHQPNRQPALEPATAKDHDTPMFHFDQAPPARRKKSRKPVKILVALLILAGLAAAGYWWAYPKYLMPNPFSADVQTNAGMSLFYPAELPAGYRIDNSGIKLVNGVVIYSAKNGQMNLVFTAQKTPPSFDFNAFYQKQLTDSHKFATKYGQAVIGKTGGHLLGSLVADNTWLLLSTNSSQVTYNDISLVLNNLKKY